MTSLSFLALIIVISLCVSQSYSEDNCKFQQFQNNKLFANCKDLPHLKSHLHWSYNASNSSLSIAFIAPPARRNGWIAWAINPTGTGMVGAQAFIAHQAKNSVMTVKTYNISSHDSVVESKLSFDVWDMSADITDGIMKIFASVKVPKKAVKINQVWQVGSSVGDDGMPMKHEFRPGNLKSKGAMKLIGARINGGRKGRVSHV